MLKVYVSACLLGEKCRYDGDDNYLEKIEELKKYAMLISFCPELEGNLKTPRTPSEIKGAGVISKDNKDRTMNFNLGAKKAQKLVLEQNIKYALCKEKSPSCGVHKIYDGTFSGTLINGMGITTRALKDCNIIIFSENEIDELIETLKTD